MYGEGGMFLSQKAKTCSIKVGPTKYGTVLDKDAKDGEG